MLGTLALAVVREFFWLSRYEDEETEIPQISGYIKYTTLFLKPLDPTLRIEIFKHKQKLIEHINERYRKLGYQRKVTKIHLL